MTVNAEKLGEKLNLDGTKVGPVLIIAGMHRSGTSFVSSILKEAGLHVGERLSPGELGNTKGFFENTDFVHLHARILKHFGFNTWSLEKIDALPESLLAEVENTVKANAQPGPWGWKDPRSTLFLDFWLKALPEAKFLFVYRSPWEVIDSLYRRGDKAFQEDPILALRVWEHYNKLALDFYNRHRDKSVLVHVDAVAASPAPLVEALKSRLSLPLNVPVSTTFDKSMFRKEPQASKRPALIKTCFPETYQLWQTLEDSADIKREAHQESVADSRSNEFAEQVFGDWMETRKLQLGLSQMEKTLNEVRKDLEQSNEKIDWIEKSRIWKIRGKLSAIRDILTK